MKPKVLRASVIATPADETEASCATAQLASNDVTEVNLIRRIVDGSAQEFENLLGGLVAGQSEVGIDLAVIRSRGGVGFRRHSRFPKRSGKPSRLRGG